VTVGQLTRIGQELASFAGAGGGAAGTGAGGPLRDVSSGAGGAEGPATFAAAGSGPFDLTAAAGGAGPGPGAAALTSGAGATNARIVLPKTVATPISASEVIPRATTVLVLSGTRGSIQSTG
jgi:hypothetical protein